MRLKDKVAIVVGAGSIRPGMGNGKATAILFAKEGASVIIADRQEDLGNKLAQELGSNVSFSLTDVKEESNAVVICIMDTSGSMDQTKKFLARSFYFLLYQFVKLKYRNTELVFIAHHTEAKEVTENEFFHKGESGGTLISSGYNRALEIIKDRYHPSLWNIYAFHCSDGDNWSSDNDSAVKAARELIEACNLFGYGEIKPGRITTFESSMFKVFEPVKADNFMMVKITRKSEIWPAFKSLITLKTVPLLTLHLVAISS